MEIGKLGNEEIVEYYRKDTEKLLKYLSWLESKSGSCTYSNYGAEGIAENSVSFPVYDGTLMSFVKEAGNTCFMERNYAYVYTRNWIKPRRMRKRPFKMQLSGIWISWQVSCPNTF